MSRIPRKSRLSNRLTARAKLWLELDGRYVFGRGISEILKAIQQTGSIKAAARELDKSYRYIWAKLKQTEQALGLRLVQARVGGQGARRSELTPLAQSLVSEFDALRDELFEIVEHAFAERLQARIDRAAEREAADPANHSKRCKATSSRNTCPPS